jgi:hypothetical protein
VKSGARRCAQKGAGGAFSVCPAIKWVGLFPERLTLLLCSGKLHETDTKE